MLKHGSIHEPTVIIDSSSLICTSVEGRLISIMRLIKAVVIAVVLIIHYYKISEN